MKKLYGKSTVHPSPPAISDQLSFLPATILTLAAALSPEDREVLAYLISCSSAGSPPFNFSGNPRLPAASKAVVDGDHEPLFNCSCFRCYTSYWARWNESPNRERIHEIIDAFEDGLAQSNNKGGKKGKGRKEKRNKKGSNKHTGELTRSELASSGNNNESGELESVGESSTTSGGGGEAAVTERVVDEEKGSVRRFVSFIGEKIWGGAWGQ